MPARRINEIVQGKRRITPDTTLRLSRYFGLSERFWMNLQTRYDLEVEKDRLAERLQQEMRVFVPVPAAPPISPLDPNPPSAPSENCGIDQPVELSPAVDVLSHAS